MTISSNLHLDTDDDFILHLYRRPETVFTIDEIGQLNPGISHKSLRNRLYYFAKAGKILRLHQGIYAKEQFEPLELANKLYKPSYISLETVLVKGAVVFQYYETIYVCSYLTRMVTVGDVTIQYRQIKDKILTNSCGIELKNGYSIATVERAFLDAVYMYKNYHFDNLRGVNWEKIPDLSKIYHSAVFEKRVKEYYNTYKEENAQP